MKINPERLEGTIYLQPSKSYLHRIIIMSALSKRTVRIDNVNYSEDIKATLGALNTMGIAKYERNKSSLLISPGDGKIKGEIDCGESGSTLRFLIALGLTMDRELVFTGHGRLMERPQNVYSELCASLGFLFKQQGDKLKIRGNLEAGEYSLPGNVSSQFISGLLMALSKIDGKSSLNITGKLESSGYVDITCDVLKTFGIYVDRAENKVSVKGGISAPDTIRAQGDWSHAANFACMAAKSGGITLKGLDVKSLQKDRQVIDILKTMGADIVTLQDGAEFLQSEIKGMDIDGRDIPDIIPVLCVLLGVCPGRWTVKNVSRLRIKESDRVEAVCRLINNLGGKAESTENSIIIDGVKHYTGGRVSSFNDHRIAMAGAVASCYSKGIIEIDNGGCVAKSAPDFWKEFLSLGGKITEEEDV